MDLTELVAGAPHCYTRDLAFRRACPADASALATSVSLFSRSSPTGHGMNPDWPSVWSRSAGPGMPGVEPARSASGAGAVPAGSDSCSSKPRPMTGPDPLVHRRHWSGGCAARACRPAPVLPRWCWARCRLPCAACPVGICRSASPTRPGWRCSLRCLVHAGWPCSTTPAAAWEFISRSMPSPTGSPACRRTCGTRQPRCPTHFQRWRVCVGNLAANLAASPVASPPATRTANRVARRVRTCARPP